VRRAPGATSPRQRTVNITWKNLLFEQLEIKMNVKLMIIVKLNNNYNLPQKVNGGNGLRSCDETIPGLDI
jgi:hypothetical protein